MPRVALVLGSSTGGIGRHVASLAAGLTERGMPVAVYGPAGTEETFGFAAAGAGFVPVSIPAVPTPRDASAVSQLRRALQSDPPEVVHAHGLRAGLVASWACPTGVPLVVTWHNAMLTGGMRGRLLGLAERRVARCARVTLCASADLVERARHLGAPDVRLAPVAAPTRRPPARSARSVRLDLGVPAGAPLVLSVGRLHPQKNYRLLVEAAARWRDRDPAPVVVIAGTGPEYLRLAGQVSVSRAPVLLLGHREDVPELLAAADLAVVTSRWEARQLFAQEALAAGVPLVATAVGGLPELLGDAAVLVPPEDLDAFDAAVTDLLDDPRRRSDLAERGRRRAAGWPTPAQTIDLVAEVYAQVTSPAVAG